MSERDGDLRVEPSATEKEVAAIAVALAIVRQQATTADSDATPLPSRWREAGRREALRDDRSDR